MVQIPIPEKPLDLSEESLQAVNGQEPQEEEDGEASNEVNGVEKDNSNDENSEKFAQESDDSDPEEEAPEKRSTVIILARTHPTEANTSFIVQGRRSNDLSHHDLA